MVLDHTRGMFVKLDVCGLMACNPSYVSSLTVNMLSECVSSVDVCGEVFFWWSWRWISCCVLLLHLAERSGDFSMEAAEWQTISQPAKALAARIWQNRGDSIIRLERFKQYKSVVILRDFPLIVHCLGWQRSVWCNFYPIICAPFKQHLWMKDLIRQLLVVDPLQRLSAAKVLEHPWASWHFETSDTTSSAYTKHEIRYEILSYWWGKKYG